MEKFFSDVRSVLSTTPERWQRLAHALPDDLLQRKPKPGEWSALECLSHIVDTEAVFTFRLSCFLAGEDFPAFNPAAQETKASLSSVKDLAAGFVRIRQESLKKLEAVTDKDLDRTARHAELGPVSLCQMLNEWAAHDLMHTAQAEQALMQPFIDACGPWQRFFLEHWVGAK
jgi:hypothetical protein